MLTKISKQMNDANYKYLPFIASWVAKLTTHFLCVPGTAAFHFLLAQRSLFLSTTASHVTPREVNERRQTSDLAHPRVVALLLKPESFSADCCLRMKWPQKHIKVDEHRYKQRRGLVLYFILTEWWNSFLFSYNSHELHHLEDSAKQPLLSRAHTQTHKHTLTTSHLSTPWCLSPSLVARLSALKLTWLMTVNLSHL